MGECFKLTIDRIAKIVIMWYNILRVKIYSKPL